MAAAVAMASIGSSSPALAQTGSAERQIEEVVVTAQRIEQSLQDVPISVAAIGGEALDARQIDAFDQLQYVVPGLTFSAGVNARQSASTIRGIGTSLFNIGIEGSVAVAVDGVILGREGAGLFDLSDIERVEVLRGPQGTLFGKNASAGVISITTRAPTDTPTANVSVSYGSKNEVKLSGAVSGPIADHVRGRLSGYRNTRDGFITNVNPDAPQRKINERDEWGLRGRVDVDVTDSFELRVSADYARRDQASGALTLRSASAGGPGTGLLGFGVPVIGPQTEAQGITPGPNNRQIASQGAFESDMESYGALVEVDLDLGGGFNLVSLSSYRRWQSQDNNDAALIPLPFLAVNSGDLEQKQYSHEVRLVSPRDQRLTYTLGAYYFIQEMQQQNTQSGTAGLDLLGALPPGVLLGTDLASSFDETNYALFGQGEYRLTDELQLIAGLRVLRSEIDHALFRTVTPGTVGPYAGQNVTEAPLFASNNDTDVVWRLGAQYYVHDDLNFFATVTRGYKSAGIVGGLTINATEPGGTTLPTVDAEKPTQYEIGMRSQALDGRLTTNLTAFYSTIDDFQAQALVPGPDGTAIFSVTNAGKVRTWGLEGDVTFLPTSQLTLSTALAYTRARFRSFDGAPCYPLQPVGDDECVDTTGNGVGEFQDLSGGRLAQAPDWVVNALARYDVPLAGGNDLFGQIGVSYRSSTLGSNTNDPNTRMSGYALVDAQVGVDFWDGRGTFTLFGRNLLNKDFVEAVVPQSFDTGGYAQFQSFESQRSFGARIALRY